MKDKDFNHLKGRSWGAQVNVEHPDGGVMWIRPPELSEFTQLHRLLETEVSKDTGSVETMISVFRINPDSFWAIDHLSPDAEQPRLTGFYSFLPLNADGLAALESYTLDRASPPLSMIAPYGTEPAGIYLWAVVARKIAKRINPLIDKAMGPLYLNVPVYALASTDGGLKAGTERGFAPAGDRAQNSMGRLMKLPPPSRERVAR